MSILDRILPWRKKESVSTLDLFRQIYGGGRQSTSGKTVTIDTAVQVSTVFGCVRVIAEGIAQVPLKLMRADKDGRRRSPAKEHPLYGVLNLRPNPWQTSFEYRETLGWHVALAGRHFSFKNIVGGKVRELIPLDPNSVTVIRNDDYSLEYDVTAPNGKVQRFPAEAIWHVRGPSWDSWQGIDVLSKAREAVGLAIATEEQHARMHRNGIRSSGVYSVDGTLSKEQFKQLRDWIETEMGGPENIGRPMVLDRGAKWLSNTMTGVDAQHIETRKLQIEEICRFFRVMPIMIGYSDKAATYASAEQMFLAHLVHCLAPWYQRLEQSIDANLLTEADRKAGLYSQFVEEALLRGSAEATANVLEKLVNGGLMKPNEGRAKLDLDADDDPASDKLRVPANIVGKPQPQKEPVNGNP